MFTAPGELYIFWSRLADCQSLKPRLHTQPQLDLSYPLPSGYGLTARLWGCATGQGRSVRRRVSTTKSRFQNQSKKNPSENTMYNAVNGNKRNLENESEDKFNQT